MTDSTKRTIRTVVQMVLGLAGATAVAVPLIGAQFAPLAGAGAIALGIAAAVTKVWNGLESAGKIPAWLK